MDLEIRPLNFNAKFEDMEVFDDGDITFYKFKNVVYGSVDKPERIRVFKGSYVPIVPSPHYFHFIKEGLGTYLHYKKHININAKVLWVDLKWDPTEYHNAQKPIQETLEILTDSGDSIVFMPMNVLEDKNNEFSPVMFEEVIIGYDPAVLVTTLFPRFDQFKHHNNDLVRDFFSKFLIKDESMPKKIYISRREVSEVLAKNDDKDNVSRYNEKYIEDAIEDFYNNLGYKSINLSGMSIKDQIKYFYNASSVAGLLGAGIWNGIFADNGTEFFVLKTHKWFHHEYDKDISSVINSKYRVIELYDKVDYNDVYSSLLKAHASYSA